MLYCCYLCQKYSVETMLTFTDQPVSHHFLSAPTMPAFQYTLQLGYCGHCGLTQLINPPPVTELKPHFPWIRYSEPEGHLNALVEVLMHLPGITQDALICGVSDFEVSTLERLKQKGFTHLQLLAVDADRSVLSVIERIQLYQTHQDIEQCFGYRERPRLIIVRDILEHAQDPLQLMQALRAMVHEDGYIVFEVPDYSKPFDQCDYSTLWEEHVSYFLPETLVQSLAFGGFSVYQLERYHYHAQDYLVAITCPAQSPVHYLRDDNLFNKEKQRMDFYTQQYSKRCAEYRAILSEHRRRGPIALLGAGHLACHFINLMQLGDLIDFVVDDHPQKCGLFMPGSGLPILPSRTLQEKKVQLCLMSVSQESEVKVLHQQQTFIEQGGQFASIFPGSQYALTACTQDILH